MGNECHEKDGTSYGQQMNLLACLLANALAEGRTTVELEFLSSILQLAGEALSVIASTQAICLEQLGSNK